MKIKNKSLIILLLLLCGFCWAKDNFSLSITPMIQIPGGSYELLTSPYINFSDLEKGKLNIKYNFTFTNRKENKTDGEAYFTVCIPTAAKPVVQGYDLLAEFPFEHQSDDGVTTVYVCKILDPKHSKQGYVEFQIKPISFIGHKFSIDIFEYAQEKFFGGYEESYKMGEFIQTIEVTQPVTMDVKQYISYDEKTWIKTNKTYITNLRGQYNSIYVKYEIFVSDNSNFKSPYYGCSIGFPDSVNLLAHKGQSSFRGNGNTLYTELQKGKNILSFRVDLQNPNCKFMLKFLPWAGDAEDDSMELEYPYKALEFE